MKKVVLKNNSKHHRTNLLLHLLPILVFGFVLAGHLSGHSQTVIGGNIPDNSAMLDVQSTSKGILFPRMNTVQRNNITSPAFGLMILNTETGCLEMNLGSSSADWKPIKCATKGTVTSLKCSCNEFRQVGSALMPGNASSQSIRLAYTGGNGDLYDGQSFASTGVSGLTATLAAGIFASGNDSLTLTITGTPAASNGLASFALSIGGQSCTLNVPVGCGAYLSACGDWTEFACYNLGAVGSTEVPPADPFTPSWKLIGDYYQWGYMGKAAPGPSGSDLATANEGKFPTFPAGYTWNTLIPSGTDWTDASPMVNNNPCPTGFRVPTKTQWDNVAANNTLSDPSGAVWMTNNINYSSGKFFGLNLFLPAAGNRGSGGVADGEQYNRGNEGLYWSSTSTGAGTNNAWLFAATSSGTTFYTVARLDGGSIRCIKE